MITELMIILTVVGAAIVLVVWTGARRRRSETVEVEDSTARFRQDLETTANEIIGRMENQATHLETLLDDSIRNRTQLEGRMAEMKKLLKRGESQSGEVRELLTRLDSAAEDVGAMKRQIEYVEKKISAVAQAKNATLQKIAAYQQAPNPAANPQPAASFATVLEKSVAAAPSKPTQTATRSAAILPRDTKPAEPANPDAARIEAIRQNLIKNAAKLSAQQNAAAKPAPNVRPPNIPVVKKNDGLNRQASALIPAAQNITPKNPPSPPAPEKSADSVSIRDMLLAGKSVEEISRKTGLGRGAVELVQQMMRHQLEKRNG